MKQYVNLINKLKKYHPLLFHNVYVLLNKPGNVNIN